VFHCRDIWLVVVGLTEHRDWQKHKFIWLHTFYLGFHLSCVERTELRDFQLSDQTIPSYIYEWAKPIFEFAGNTFENLKYLCLRYQWHCGYRVHCINQKRSKKFTNVLMYFRFCLNYIVWISPLMVTMLITLVQFSVHNIISKC
jgi:hypothetical protein